MLQVRDITAGYGTGLVLHELSLSVANGEIVGILGRNGMGKTTLVRVLAGLLEPKSGAVILDDVDITTSPPHQRCQHGIAIVPQGRGIFRDLSVEENLRLGELAAGRRRRKGRIDDVYAYFPRLSERRKQAAGTMSGGEQQMLAIGRALMVEPRLLVLDEPSDGIMPVLVQQIARNLHDINREEGLTTLAVEQNVPMMKKMASRCVIIEGGRVVADDAIVRLEEQGAIDRYLAV